MVDTLAINEKIYSIKNSFGAIMEFERLAKKKSADMDSSITDIVTLLYATLKYNNKGTFTYTFDEFIALLDIDNTPVQQFTNHLVELQKETILAFEEEIKKKIEELKKANPTPKRHPRKKQVG